MTTTSASARTVQVHPEAFVDILAGYLYVNTNFTENWSAGLLGHRPHDADLALAYQLIDRGYLVLRFTAEDLLNLQRGCVLEKAGGSHRYLITVTNVEEVGELLGDVE